MLTISDCYLSCLLLALTIKLTMNYKIFVFGFISCVWAQVPYPGGCPNVAVVQNFNLNKVGIIRVFCFSHKNA